MSFIEVEFFYFAPIAILLYWLLPRKVAAQNVYLVCLSAVFYCTSSWRLYCLLFSGATLDFILMRYIQHRPNDKANAGKRRSALFIGLLCALGSLAYFKYFGFFIQSMEQLVHRLGLGSGVSPAIHIILPLGISFYTLQRVGCMLDVYWERAKAPDSYVAFLLFASFFPQLSAGPISRNGELLPQLSEPRRPAAEHFAEGSGAFFLGFCLKALIAEQLATYWVAPVFAASANFNRLGHLLAVVGYAFQVFADFAGYSLMAIGIARLFGIRLPNNFNYPFLSRNLPELWRRWHITLNRWLFDYIFTPLSTSRGWFRGRLDLALLITFLASGIWHGAAWTFVVWGLMHGLGMITQRRWDERYRQWCRKDRRFVQLRKSNFYSFVSWAITIAFFTLSLIPFRSTSIGGAIRFAREMLFTPGLEGLRVGRLTLLYALVIAGYHLLELKRFGSLREGYFKLPALVRGVIYGCIVVFLLLKVPVGTGTFIYQQF